MGIAGNLLPAGIRQRRTSGAVAVAAALALTAIVLLGLLPPIALVAVFALHAFGFLGLLQAKAKT